MTSPPGRETDLQCDMPATGRHRLQVAAVFAAFFVYSAICRTVPSVNEPHYLGKAKHYWQPQWCTGDLFLESSNPHLVFYQTIGVLTQWLTLPQAAWVGRVLALVVLAWGWTRLTSKLTVDRWAAVPAACLFLLLQALGNFSGEWLVGGVESKVFAYAFAFAGWASMMERRWIPAATWLGASLSVHAVVGGWCVIATMMAAGYGWLFGSKPPESTSGPNAQRSIPTGRLVAAFLLMVACSLPGMIPAVRSLTSVDPEAAALADRYQVGTRLAHHLDPMAFPVEAYRYYGLLIVVWLLLRSRLAVTEGYRGIVRLTMAAVLIAIIGFVIGWGPRPIQEMPLTELRVWLLKFYPFRLADILVPLLLSATVVNALNLTSAHNGSGGRLWRPMILAAATGLALWLPNVDKNPSRMTDARRADWLGACEWIRQESPPDALLYAANEHWAVKWFCHRAEYFNYKDCPQDAEGILEWVRRLQRINRWHGDAFRDGRISAEELDDLHAQTGITHLIVSRLGPIDVDPVYRNGSFRVYDLNRP